MLVQIMSDESLDDDDPRKCSTIIADVQIVNSRRNKKGVMTITAQTYQEDEFEFAAPSAVYVISDSGDIISQMGSAVVATQHIESITKEDQVLH